MKPDGPSQAPLERSSGRTAGVGPPGRPRADSRHILGSFPAQVALAALALVLAWEALALIVRRPILPSPILVFQAFFTGLAGDLGLHFLASLWRVVASTALAVALAVPAGLVLGQSERLNRVFTPLLYLLLPIPKVVLIPVILLFLGVGDLPKIVIIFLILFFQILVLVRDQAAGIRPELVHSVRSLGAGRRALFRFVYLPASLPAILTALRQSVGTAVAVLYVAELFATQRGLGYYIFLAGSTLFDYPKMYAGVVAMSLLGLGLYFAVDALHRRLCPWQFVG
ncbi:MAG TPA: ABC transporter permease [Anaerolineales bacterium]|nr:ABC transporter permease [Anaerolineales bacterium]